MTVVDAIKDFLVYAWNKRQGDGKQSHYKARMFLKTFPYNCKLFYIHQLHEPCWIIVTKTQDKNNGYSYNVTTVILLVELVKLAATVGIYCSSGGLAQLVEETWLHRKVLALYLVPGGLYCLSNNLVFTSLSNFDPTTYMLLLQLRVLVTGLVYQMVFKQNLSRVQWFSLFVLTLGCAVKQLDVQPKAQEVELSIAADKSETIFSHGEPDDHVRKLLASFGLSEKREAKDHLKATTNQAAPLPIGLMLLFLQVLCSCFASVYNERILKSYSADLSIVLHSFFMYIDSSLSNLVLLTLKGELISAFSSDALLKITTSPLVLLVVLNNAALGLVTSVFLKHLNSILKVFASAIEPGLLAVLCYIIFGYEVTVYTLLSIVLVAGATLLYALSPLPVLPSVIPLPRPPHRSPSTPASLPRVLSLSLSLTNRCCPSACPSRTGVVPQLVPHEQVFPHLSRTLVDARGSWPPVRDPCRESVCAPWSINSVTQQGGLIPARGDCYLLQGIVTCCRGLLPAAGDCYLLQGIVTCCRGLLPAAGDCYLVQWSIRGGLLLPFIQRDSCSPSSRGGLLLPFIQGGLLLPFIQQGGEGNHHKKMLCRTSISFVRFCSKGSAFKPVNFRHNITETDFDFPEVDRPGKKFMSRKHNPSGRESGLGEGEMPVIKTPLSRPRYTGDQSYGPKKTHRHGLRFNSRADEAENSDKYNYNGSQTFSDQNSVDVEKFQRYSDDSQASESGVEDKNYFFNYPRSSNKKTVPSGKNRRNREMDTRWSFSRFENNKKKMSWKHKKEDDRALNEINEMFEGEESILREYGDKEHVYGVHPVMLALKAGRREIHRVYCKEGLEDSNPLVGEIHKLCVDKGIEFRSVDGKVFKKVFEKGTVHQGVFCFAGYLPIDVFDVGQLNEAENGISCTSPSIDATLNSGKHHNDVEDPSSETKRSLINEKDDSELPVREKSMASTADVDNASTISCEFKEVQRKRLWVVLDRVLDPMNVGAILRSCCYFGVSRVLMTPSSAEVSPVVCKASSGAVELLRLSLLPRPSEQLLQLQARGWHVVAAAPEVRPRATGLLNTDLDNPFAREGKTNEALESLQPPGQRCGDGDRPPAEGLAAPSGADFAPGTSKGQRCVAAQNFVFDRDTVLIVGNEGSGICSSVEGVADTVVTVPSVLRDGCGEDRQTADGSDLPCLNVSVATAVILHAITALARRA
ncbi:tRNA/rRNA methyltransferase SpoU type [Trinorchestia longiramus]|nr:tRNA/rRNA methyltransferase SpoU type [Trinorchestia longiramus]